MAFQNSVDDDLGMLELLPLQQPTDRRATMSIDILIQANSRRFDVLWREGLGMNSTRPRIVHCSWTQESQSPGMIVGDAPIWPGAAKRKTIPTPPAWRYHGVSNLRMQDIQSQFDAI